MRVNAMNTAPKESGGVSHCCAHLAKALGTAATLSFIEYIGMAFDYHLLLQKRERGLG